MDSIQNAKNRKLGILFSKQKKLKTDRGSMLQNGTVTKRYGYKTETVTNGTCYKTVRVAKRYVTKGKLQETVLW
jgi:hypothetical protein